MNTHELIESTMLHALGLLENDEREAYEAAFNAAPASVQQQVRQEARRMADLGDLIPEVEPSVELRSVVLAAVRAAMREDENEARIAKQHAAGAAPVIARIDQNTPAPVRATAQPKISMSTRVHSIWRVAAIGFAAASIAMGVVMVKINQDFQNADRRALVNNLYDQIGAQYLESTIFDANTRRVALTSTDSSNKAVAAVWYNPDWNTARLFVKNLSSEQNKPLRLVVLDENDNIVREIQTFTPSGELEDFDVQVNLSTERKLAIYPAIQNEIAEATGPVLMSANGSL
ncbi:MAG: hypothetical protein CMJ35_04260 [Phycisphaerae bacterium]|mgnify:CR=1 FL=1|nr:hypothetical protein [Phycisphaerae bacterium]MBM90813.1 hypothetical protein [Phycisphaerae bacterium]